MAEIKSTLDLVMEKTKDLVLSDEERKELSRKEWRQKAAGWVRRFLEGLWSDGRLKEAVEEVETGSRDDARKAAALELLGALDLGDRGRRCLKGLEVVASEMEKPHLELVREVLSSYESARSRIPGEEEKRLKEELAAEGIGGSAVVVLPRRSPRWTEEEDRFRARLKEAVDSWQAALEA